MTFVNTLKDGATSDARRIIVGATSNAAPIATDEGFNVQGAQFLHIYVQFNAGATSCQITPWYWSDIAVQWFAGEALTFTSAPEVRLALVQVQGEHRVYLRLDSVAGGNIHAWAGWSDDTPEE